MLNRSLGSISGLLRVAAVVVAAAVTGFTCHKAPSGWEKTDENTIRQNLAVVDSAGAAYNVQLSAGRRDLAVQDAQTILMGHPGTDTVLVAEDSTVWVYFRNQMVSGLGELAWSDTSVGSAKRPASSRRRARAASGNPGGNLFPFATFVVPFSEELPGTEREAYAIAARLDQLPGWSSSRIYLDSSVTVEVVRGLISGESPVLFWAGHGVLVPDLGAFPVPGLLTGKPYTRDEMARAAANEYKSYLNHKTYEVPEAATFLDGKTGKQHMVILPNFIWTYGNYEAWDVPANGNCTKTLVYLSCCYSSKWMEVRGSFGEPFINAGADVFCGWDWVVGDRFAVDKDTTFFRLMCDTFMPREAYRALGVVTDPKPFRGSNATLAVNGDSFVMVQPVLLATLDGVARRAEQVSADTSAVGASITGRIMSAAREDLGKLTVSFPGPAAGSYDFATVDGARAEWNDQVSGRTYTAQKDYQGVDGNISVSYFASNVILAQFSGTLGWWDTGRDPKQDQPEAVVEILNGRVKFTGKMGADSIAPREATYHHGHIDADETWSPSGNPHIIDSSVYVRNGAWVTIEPGCTVKTADYHGLEVGYFGRGGIKAIGTASAPILFTSNNASPAPGDWGGIAIEDSALPGTRLSYCTIEYAGSMQALSGAAFSVLHGNAVAEIDNCTIRLGGRHGVWVDSFSDLASFHDNTVTANGSYALCVGPQVAGILDAGNTLTGNDSVGVLLAGPLKTSATWPNLGVPYVIKGVQVGDTANDPVLTIEPGTEVWFRKTGSLTAGSTGGTRTGRIVADGSAGRITFTSMATSPAPGDFYGVSVYEGSSTESEFRSCDFSYGGQGGGDHALLTVHKCNPVVTGCDFGHSAGYGMLFATTQYPDTLAIKAVNTFHDNASGTIKWVMPFPGR